MKKPLLLLLAAAVSAAPAFAQKSASSAHPEDELHRQIEAVSGPTPAFKAISAPAVATESKTTEETPARPAEKKAKGPTEIDSLEATFDQKANLAIFIGEVVVTDPEFNVKCDKLTAYLKSAEKPKTAAEEPAPKPAKPATPSPATPGPSPEKKKGGGGLQKATAEANAGNRVIITQDKTDADGTVQHSIGKGDKATYNAETGDIVLYGTPEIQQGINLVVATSASTVMTLNRDGHMHSKGPTKTIIVDKGDAGL